MNPTPLEAMIHNTLAYFAYNQYPLTVFELFKWQYKPVTCFSYQEMKEVLDHSEWLGQRIGHCDGMYAIGTDAEVELQVSARKRRFLDAVKKQKKACRVARYLAVLGSVKGIAICNSLAYHFTREKSDIDFFVITKKGRIWSARFWSVLPMIVLRQRPGETRVNPVDISFFVSENALDLSSIKIGPDDPYLAFWIKNLTPIFGSEELWNAFFKANAWTDAYLPCAKRPRRTQHLMCKSRIRLPHIIPEWFLRVIQRMKLPYHIKQMANQDTRVVINASMLKFHTIDRRAEIATALSKKHIDICNG